jgi:transposase InsO family protein
LPEEFLGLSVRQWLSNVGVTTLFVEPGSPCENGYVESFNGKPRDELLNVRSSSRSGRPDPDRTLAAGV